MSASPSGRSPHAKTIIIGSGPAGYTAAIYAARAMLEPLLIAGFEAGGQLMITTDVENYPGFAEAIQGPWLMEQMRAQAEHVGTHMISDHHRQGRAWPPSVPAVRRQRRSLCLRYAGDRHGRQGQMAEFALRAEFKGYGVSACATCDGFFYRGKEVVVVGGGNSAVEEALYLSHLAAKVTVVHRGVAFRAERILQERLFKRDNVEVIWAHVVDEIHGSGRSSERHPCHPEERQDRRAARRFRRTASSSPSATRRPPSLFEGQLDIKPNGYIRTAPDSTATSVPGVFAAGDVTDDVYRQAVTAAGMGCMAALEAERWLAAENHKRIAAE